MDANSTATLTEAMISEDADLVQAIRAAGEETTEIMTGDDFLSWLSSL